MLQMRFLINAVQIGVLKNNLNSVELASGRVKSFEKLTIDIVNIDNLIKTNKIEDDTYEGTICLYYKDN